MRVVHSLRAIVEECSFILQRFCELYCKVLRVIFRKKLLNYSYGQPCVMVGCFAVERVNNWPRTGHHVANSPIKTSSWFVPEPLS